MNAATSIPETISTATIGERRASSDPRIGGRRILKKFSSSRLSTSLPPVR
jgi:hypothetical protein